MFTPKSITKARNLRSYKRLANVEQLFVHMKLVQLLTINDKNPFPLQNSKTTYGWKQTNRSNSFMKETTGVATIVPRSGTTKEWNEEIACTRVSHGLFIPV